MLFQFKFLSFIHQSMINVIDLPRQRNQIIEKVYVQKEKGIEKIFCHMISFGTKFYSFVMKP